MRMEAIQGNFHENHFASKKPSLARSTRILIVPLFFISFLLFNESSCGEGEDYHQFLNRNRNRHNRRLFRRLNNINHNHLDSQQIIPRQNVRMRSLFDRVNQEIEKYRRK